MKANFRHEILLWSFSVSDISSIKISTKSCPCKCGVCQMDISKTGGVGLWLRKIILHKLNFILDPLLQKQILRPPPKQTGLTHPQILGCDFASQSEVDREGPRNPLRKFEKIGQEKLGFPRFFSLHHSLTNSFLNWTLFPIWWLISYLPINSWIHLESRQNTNSFKRLLTYNKDKRQRQRVLFGTTFLGFAKLTNLWKMTKTPPNFQGPHLPEPWLQRCCLTSGSWMGIKKISQGGWMFWGKSLTPTVVCHK